MPKGVYDRSGRGKSAVISPVSPISPIAENTGNPGKTQYHVNMERVGQMPDIQSANHNVEVQRQVDGEESTTDRLFPDIAQRDALDETDPNRSNSIEQKPLEVEPVAQNPEQAEEPRFQKEASTPEEMKNLPPPVVEPEEYIDWDKLAGKKIKQKINGKEVIVTAEELKHYSDQDQIKKAMGESAWKIGEERRQLAEERMQLQQLRQQRAAQYEAPIRSGGEPYAGIPPAPQYDPVMQEIQMLKMQVQQMAQNTQPVIYQSNRQRVADELKSQGFNDFMDYLPKMEVHIGTIQDPQLTQFYDTPQGAKALYFQLKAQDLQRPQTPVRQSQAPNVPQRTMAPAQAPAAQIDGGTQGSGNYTDDSGHQYRQAFKKATALGDDREAWNEVLRQKGILPE